MNSIAKNDKFWNLVKKLLKDSNSTLKPCQFYEKNKKKVNDEYMKTKFKEINKNQ